MSFSETMKRLAFTLFAVFAAVMLCSAQNPNETRVVKDASGRVKYTVQKTGDREIIKDSKGKVVGSTRQTKELNTTTIQTARRQVLKSNENRQADSGKEIIRQILNRTTGSNWVLGGIVPLPKGCGDSTIPVRSRRSRWRSKTIFSLSDVITDLWEWSKTWRSIIR